MTSNLTTWAVIADTNICRIYYYKKRPELLILLKELCHPENKLKDSELTSDKPGQYQTNSHAQGAYSQQTDPKEVRIVAFAREIVKELEAGRNENSYQKLIIVAPPHMLGLLNQHMNKHIKNLVVHHIEKDWAHLPNPDLLNSLQAHTEFVNV